MSQAELLATIKAIAVPGKGILAADESDKTIAKRFKSINLESTEESRRAYREMLFTTPEFGQYVSGVILYEETLYQKHKDGTPFPELLAKQGAIPGIKVDKGLVDLPNCPGEQITQGLDGLTDRLKKYKEQGARFAKWREVYHIGDVIPSSLAIKANAEMLAFYAAACQEQGIVPIVEPEVLIDGSHTLARCFAVTEAVLHAVFKALYKHKILLEGMILKPSMVISGNQCAKQADVQEVAEQTLTVLRRYVPAAVPTINFLSGGQSSEVATAHLNAMNKDKNNPWNLSFSYGRALQDHALKAWGGKPENVAVAQHALHKRLKLNGLASVGKYDSSME
ncbi:MAG: fda [Gammaproteobacteria bacterium]|jgi:fructose-bisphosphate aldolase class I|nr:fda [Gammaproteobacteria bacterium]